MAGAIEDFDLVRFGGPTRVEEFDVVVATSDTIILKGDPDRVLVILTNNDVGAVYWSTVPISAALSGFGIGSGLATTFQVQNDGALCGQPIHGIAPAGALTIHVLTLKRYRTGS